MHQPSAAILARHGQQDLKSLPSLNVFKGQTIVVCFRIVANRFKHQVGEGLDIDFIEVSPKAADQLFGIAVRLTSRAEPRHGDSMNVGSRQAQKIQSVGCDQQSNR